MKIIFLVIVVLGLVHAASTTGPVPMNSDCRLAFVWNHL